MDSGKSFLYIKNSSGPKMDSIEYNDTVVIKLYTLIHDWNTRQLGMHLLAATSRPRLSETEPKFVCVRNFLLCVLCAILHLIASQNINNNNNNNNIEFF